MHLYCGADVHVDGLERIAGNPCWQFAAAWQFASALGNAFSA
jgi:hypothetical protein